MSDFTEQEGTVLRIESKFKVLTKPDLTARAALVPMKLFPIQKYYAYHRTRRDIICKNRQCGFSTGVLALNADALFNQKYERQTIITHDDSTSPGIAYT